MRTIKRRLSSFLHKKCGSNNNDTKTSYNDLHDNQTLPDSTFEHVSADLSSCDGGDRPRRRVRFVPARKNQYIRNTIMGRSEIRALWYQQADFNQFQQETAAVAQDVFGAFHSAENERMAAAWLVRTYAGLRQAQQDEDTTAMVNILLKSCPPAAVQFDESTAVGLERFIVLECLQLHAAIASSKRQVVRQIRHERQRALSLQTSSHLSCTWDKKPVSTSHHVDLDECVATMARQVSLADRAFAVYCAQRAAATATALFK